MRTTSLPFSITTPLLLLGVFVLAFYPQPAEAVYQCQGGDRMVTNGVCRSLIYDDGVRCPDNKPSTSCFGFEVAPGGGGVPVDVGNDATTPAELSPAGPTKVKAVPPTKGREKVAKFKAGKALADTVKRNGNASNVGGEDSGQLNREKYKKLNGDTFPPPPLLPEDDTCVSITNCP